MKTSLNCHSGLITTRVALDREERESYTLILEARDLGNPVQQTSRLLTVNVKDIDDHPPRYIHTSTKIDVRLKLDD